MVQVLQRGHLSMWYAHVLSTQVLKLGQLCNENYLSHHGNYVKHLTLKATVAQPVHYCPWRQNGFSFTLNQANDFHHSMKPQKMISILIFTFYIVNQICFIILYQIRLLFLIFEIKYCLTEVLEQPGEGGGTPALNVRAIRDQRHANVN